MANYYVSAQRGNDANPGTQAEPWLTIGKAVTNPVAAGDTIYIGPGTYRERVTLATAGSSGNPISWVPDPECRYLTDDKPGIVRVTGCDVGELPTSGRVWRYNSKNYNTVGVAGRGFNQIWIDGSSDDYSVMMSVGTNGIAHGVTAFGYSAFAPDTCFDCIGVGGNYGFNGNNTNVLTNCIASGRWPFSAIIAINCVSIGGDTGFNGGITLNCVVVGGTYGFYNSRNVNGIAIGCYYGFRGTGTHQFSSCRAVACTYGFYGDSNTSLQDVSTCTHVWCRYDTRGGGYDTGDSSAAKAVLYDLLPLLPALLPILAFDRNDGAEGTLSCISVAAGDTVTINGLTFTAHATTTTVANREFKVDGTDIQDAAELVTCINDATYGVPGVTASSATRDVHLQAADPTAFTLASSNATRLPVRTAPNSGYDILGHARLMGDGTIDIGPYEHSAVSQDWTNYKTIGPGNQIQRKGQQRFVFHGGAEEFTRSVWVKWNNVAAGLKPQLVIRGAHLAEQTVTATGDGTDWEKLTITATPSAAGELELYLYARDPDAGAIVYFSDLT